MSNDFFPPRPAANPTIYAYEDTSSQYKGLLKVGFTNTDVQKRIAQQYPTLRPGALPYKIVFEVSAMRNDGSAFTDHDVHRYLRKQSGIKNPAGEWFECTVNEVKAALLAIKSGVKNEDNRTHDFKMRPEQKEAIKKTISYFNSFKNENPNNTPPLCQYDLRHLPLGN